MAMKKKFPREEYRKLHYLRKAYQRVVRARVLLEEGKLVASREVLAGVATMLKACYETGILTEDEYEDTRKRLSSVLSLYDWVIKVSYGEGERILISNPNAYVELVEKVRYFEDFLMRLYTDKVHFYSTQRTLM